jgi:hypothetical protein
MRADYVFLCGVMWTQYASEDARLELVRAQRCDESRRGISRQRYSRKTFNSA